MPENEQQFSTRNDSKSGSGSLYVVATPIGNLDDFSRRAIEVLQSVDLILAEDTRQTGKLLQQYAIKTRTRSYHQHNEAQLLDKHIALMQEGKSIALVSDAGTPLISDPGFPLVRAARLQKLQVVPVPGASAVVAALSVAGLPVSRFCFEGFLPAKQAARLQQLQQLKDEVRTLVFYESTHRIAACLDDMTEVFGAERLAVIARELTKTFEQIELDNLSGLQAWLAASDDHIKGEFVIIVDGAQQDNQDDSSMRKLLGLLLPHMGVKQAAQIAAEFSGGGRNQMYEMALALKSEK